MPRVVFGAHKKEWSNVSPTQTQNVLVYVPYIGGALPSQGEEEEAVNYIFLLDVSSSMKENNKLKDATNAVVAALNMLTTGSTVSLLLFESYTTERFPPTVVTNTSRDDLCRNVRRIMSDGIRMGSTNMSVALNTAQEHVAQQCSTDGTMPERRACVIMFTDGRPTNGLCEYDELVAATTTMWAAIPSARLCMINFGPDADTELSRALAEAGGGEFFHTDDGGEGLKLALASVIGATRVVVATDVTMRYAVTSGAADITAVHGGKLMSNDGLNKVQIGDVPEEAVRGIAFALNIHAGDAAPVQLDVQLTGWETGTADAINETATVVITRRDEPLAAAPDLEANDQLQRVTAASAMDDAANKLYRGDNVGAMQVLNTALQAVQSSPAGVAGCTLAMHMCQELAELIQQPPAATGSYNFARLKSDANMRMRSDVRSPTPVCV